MNWINALRGPAGQAQGFPAAVRKQAECATLDGGPMHSLQWLPAGLAKLARSNIITAVAPCRSVPGARYRSATGVRVPEVM